MREWGVKGEMKALPLSDAFASLIPGGPALLQAHDDTFPCTVASLRKMNRHYILSFREIQDRDSASRFRGALIVVPAPPAARAEGEYLREEIIGLTVATSEGEELGRIVDIIATPAHDVYVVFRGGKEYLIPAVREFVVEVRLAEKKIFIKKLEGMFD